MKKEILIICKTNLQRDPRVIKQIEALHKRYNLTCVGTERSLHHGVKNDLDSFNLDGKNSTTNRITQIIKLVTKQYKSLYWSSNNKSVYETLKKRSFDLIICNETESLPIADTIANQQNIPIYLDLHEYYPANKKTGALSSLQAKYETWLLINHLNKVVFYSTVSPGIVNLYKKRFNLDCTLIDNACPYFDLSPTNTDPKNIKLVSHGAAIRGRKTELMIDMMSLMGSRYTLDLYLMSTDIDYRNELKGRASQLPKGKVNIHPGISFSAIQNTINKYDIGVYSLYPSHLNNEFALPNKTFEFIQARLAVVIGPTPDMADLVCKHKFGVVATNFSPEALANSIKQITIEDIKQYKSNAHVAAKEINAYRNIVQIKKIVDSIISQSPEANAQLYQK